MAELVAGAFLSSFFTVTLEKLTSRYFRSHKGLAEELEITLNSINQVLDEAEQKQYQSVYVKKWLDDLKHDVYEVDQLLDEIATHAQRKSKVQRFSVFANDPFESRIRNLLQHLAFLEKQKDTLGLKERTYANDEYGVHWRPLNRLPTSSLMEDDSSIYGRDANKEEIIKFLSSDNNIGSQVPILGIVGLGGMGKTTLAQLAYNDHKVQEEFDLKAWVFVSQSFDVVGLTKAILKSFVFPADCEDFNILQCELQKQIMDKKYLLVLDDVWNGNGEYWERILLPLNQKSSGSKIIVTTRDKEVASIMKSTQLLDLKQLEESECWSLFVRHAFGGRDVTEYPDLESIGRKIVDKCGGLPLAVKTLGSLLQRKFSQPEWTKILETDVWHLGDGHGDIINPTLRLSYHNLPSGLKRCFAYCSLFPKGYVFDKDQLINCWMAEGLLKCHGTHKSEEELGSEFFDDLESISFFEKSIDECDKECFTMHDLVNDLAKSVSGEFCFRIEADRVNDIPKRTRHIGYLRESKDNEQIFEQIYKIKGLRSLMVQQNRYFQMCKNVQLDLYRRLKYLRMLSFCRCYLSKLADEIGNLKLLRYLDLSSTDIISLPDSICKLFNLQTLLLENCRLRELPADFHQLVNLRHLDLRRNFIKTMPKHMERLCHLQMLDGLYMMLGPLQSNSNLSSLTINDYHGIHFPDWLGICHLPNLVSLTLKDCNFCSQLPPLGQFPFLKELSISSCDGIEIIGKELYGNNDSSNVPFRSLEIMRFEHMSYWKKWSCHEDYPSLKEIYIIGCPKLKGNLPQHLLSLEKLEINDCPELEASIPKADNIHVLKLNRCRSMLINDLPSSLKSATLLNNSFTNSSLDQILSNSALFEELYVDDYNGPNRDWFTLDLSSSNSLRTLTLICWSTSSWSFAPHFTNLHKLSLLGCPELESFPRGCLPSSLSILKIHNCPKLIASREEWGLFELNSLKEFNVSDDFKNVESFPEENLLPPNLESLHLYVCLELRTINYKGLLHLKSLNSLIIQHCDLLELLPVEEGSLSSLSTLKIFYCPLLKQRYQKDEGEQWHTISHIPNVMFLGYDD